MAEFSKLITTSDGKALIAKMLAGKADIDFTRVASSSTQYDITDLEALTELTNIQQSSLISHKEISNQLSVKLETSFTNVALTTGYYMRALGLYAVDPELTAGEILFAVTIETSGNCYIPPYNGVTVSGAVINLITTVGNAENVHMDVDPAAVATLTDLTRKVDIGGGDISKTKIVVADAVTTEFPVPDAGDTGKGFLGKMKKFCADFNNFRAGIITLGKLVNNGQCDQSGFALDARYGKTLTDLYTQLNSNLEWSENEHIAGTWLDGKNLYEKTIVFYGKNNNGVATTILINHGIPNVNRIFLNPAKSFGLWFGNTTAPLPFTDMTDRSFDISFRGFKTETFQMMYSRDLSNVQLYVTVNYTK